MRTIKNICCIGAKNLGVAHKAFLKLDLEPLKNKFAVVYDVKGVLKQADSKL